MDASSDCTVDDGEGYDTSKAFDGDPVVEEDTGYDRERNIGIQGTEETICDNGGKDAAEDAEAVDDEEEVEGCSVGDMDNVGRVGIDLQDLRREKRETSLINFYRGKRHEM